MKLAIDLRTSLTQTLTPQQIQYLKLLQLPIVQLEQHIAQEIEQNPMLEEVTPESNFESLDSSDFTDPVEEELAKNIDTDSTSIDDQKDPFEFYNLLWQDDSTYKKTSYQTYEDEEENQYFQIKDNITLHEELVQQLRLHQLTEEELLLGEIIIYNVDDDGYFRRNLDEIIEETNKQIAEINFQLRYNTIEKNDEKDTKLENPARQFAVSKEALKITSQIAKIKGDISIIKPDPEDFQVDFDDNEKKLNKLKTLSQLKTLQKVTKKQAEKVLKIIQSLDPPGFASRNIQECLIAQCKAILKPTPTQKLALKILEQSYEAFTMKHYQNIIKQHSITEEQLKEAIEVIKKLNPKPGATDSTNLSHTIIPDFIVERSKDTNELFISVNDGNLPVLKLNEAYEKLKKEAKVKVFNKETREWIRSKYENAKFLIQAIRQRKSTMLKVMTAIVQLQKRFFYKGPSALKPLIYKDVSEVTGLDISTVCRIVNGKYVQTEYGTYELKYFFSEALPSDDGEEISTRVVKQIIKEIIENESKDKPYSDDRIAKELQKRGYKIARRTVAKYREQLKIPVARLRKEL